jgi:hypothetical protein
LRPIPLLAIDPIHSTRQTIPFSDGHSVGGVESCLEFSRIHDQVSEVRYPAIVAIPATGKRTMTTKPKKGKPPPPAPHYRMMTPSESLGAMSEGREKLTVASRSTIVVLCSVAQNWRVVSA